MVLGVIVGAAAGIVGSKVLEHQQKKKNGSDDEEMDDYAEGDAWREKGIKISIDQTMNVSHDEQVRRAKYLAREFPEIDERDLKTPDNWVKRHPALIRLTGKHPFNCEASLPELFDYGFISPVNLHIVRNHGAVPKLTWETHKIKVNGNCKNPFEIGMDELSEMPYEQFPCLVVCAGNRRKEQNMVKSSIGFNWGPCAVGNTYWKGVPLRVLLNKAGIFKAGPGRRFVCLNGPQDELPKSYDGQDGGPGSYGTSIDIETALDPTCDVIVAYEQNGERLHPDHGYPVRIIIPGYIGGRMIKFLAEITVTDRESNNFYHFNDNRVLPPTVDAELATKDKWWFKEEYIINQLNINGAIAYPAHEEVIKPTAEKKYIMKGYAYSGGGRKVIRCEVSFDQGLSWKLADINVRETPRWAAGSSGDKARHWCWCMWEYEIDTSVLFDEKCKEIVFRAVDQSQNFMPERPTWNVMGMLNNPWYRVRIHKDPSGGVKMEHATIAGPTPGGWMQQMAEKAGGELLWGWGGEGNPAAP
jgi:DMSO/TMAO reductase YedYZ molybdopterin-dependent catalytic subunit